MPRTAALFAHRQQYDQWLSATGHSPGNMAHHASNCRWAVPTLSLPAPYSWDAEACPWACVRNGIPRILETTEVCADCPRWEAHPTATTGGDGSADP